MLLVVTGGIVGFLLALTGGGGSIVCVPLLLYMVKVPDTHLIIGTSAMSVAINALINL
ncbi:TPA: TSUP family transporter, partial [Serratia marcescens]|nr:TSUP family transporter [Serratia marcescens]